MPKENKSSVPPPKPEMHWILAAIAERWPAVKNFFIHLAFLVAGALAILFLYEKFIIPGKDAQIGALTQQKEKLSTDLQREDRENDKLRNENAQYQSVHDEKNFPLKKRAQILANQINDYADKLFDSLKSPNGYNQWQQKSTEWGDRFAPRIYVMLKQMDELGQHSDLFETNNYPYILNNQPLTVMPLKAMASELNKLAGGFPDVAAP